ncbi:flagellar basal body-associated protein FliL [Virgibacillus soli]|uniref:Flagellar protein FliL n=2 Tax=Lederbergia galactosidilytica TaxID=217031 RepID=A0A0Q9XYF5_9BACI|nr:flagellar basal body-associated protein FliL [Lederbergia galactosidilytica]KRG09748.1 flagellar basal body-associated protein FliL [Lederbergia galactosidilytica]KRG13475.1 flagellar basal body-associated protein FliL [Virgibacillus soli]OAK72553.1 flagellar basal body-associated protein FliL [Lederbergia galactosidilytica]
MKEMNKKLVSTMIVLLTAILLIAALALIIILKMEHKDTDKEPTIDEVLKVSVDVPEITTNLANGKYIKLSLKVQTDSQKAKDELVKRDFQIQSLLIDELSEMEDTDLEGKEEKQEFSEALKKQMNDLMQKGKVEKVYITSYIIS